MESVCGGNLTVGSNPTLSANRRQPEELGGSDRQDNPLQPFFAGSVSKVLSERQP